MKKLFLHFFFLYMVFSAVGQDLVVGANQFERYSHLIEGKSVGVVVNHTSKVEEAHLLDYLLDKNVSINAVFTPEHGLKGTADAGESIKDGLYQGKIPVYSLYGNHKKPTKTQLTGLDVVVFDIQDVGTRFYTYISTMHYVMEACAKNEISFIVLDRPNPNGRFVAGPVLDLKFQSFVGMHPIPVLHGLTVGELAKMINGEGWIESKCDLTVIPCENYAHNMKYELPIKPSPNLPNAQSIQLYPSLCLFEGTVISVGRGTYKPFQQIGHPDFGKTYSYSFTPKSIEGMAKYPKHENKNCYGYDLSSSNLQGFDLKYLYEFYYQYGERADFFKADFFDKLCGTDQIRKDILAGLKYEIIEGKWLKSLKEYREMREKYLIYP